MVCGASMTMVDEGNSVAGIDNIDTQMFPLFWSEAELGRDVCDDRYWKYQMEDAQ